MVQSCGSNSQSLSSNKLATCSVIAQGGGGKLNMWRSVIEAIGGGYANEAGEQKKYKE